MLRSLLLLFALGCQPRHGATGTTPTTASRHDVIVVGAGSAGLYAAKTLIADGYGVLIIEATDRIGGRVKSATLGDMRVELGAEEHYLQRGDNPVFPAVTKEYGESVYVPGYRGATVYSMDGGTNTCWTLPGATQSCADDPDVTEVSSMDGGTNTCWTLRGATRSCEDDPDVVEFWEIDDWYGNPDLHLDPTTSLADDVLAEYGVGFGHRAYHLYDAGFAGAEFATNLDRLGAQSLAIQDSGWDLSDGIRVLGDKDLGYSDVLQTVWWDDVVANSDLLLNSPVVTIDTSGEDVSVTDASGAVHLAHQVIVTVSIGVLQAEKIDFVPDLPTTTVDAYNGIGIDQGMKVALRFAAPWWETEGVPVGWMVTESLAGSCWIPSDYKAGTTSYVMMCYPMGDNAAALTWLANKAGGGAAGDEAIVNAILASLDATFPDEANPATANYVEGIVQNWGAAPYTLGAYSYPKVGTYDSADQNRRKDLQAPVADDRIFFAGEATHVTHPSTVVGALHEGERAALAVKAVNGNPGNPP
ncbi:MAG: FAD-dependent oxidoreductase [Planctomycetes bacterium]|nr:FAD-dependent oxidoreductase [Planctomycetota bacterium]